ncbi:PP2C family protein-serine/threonine phosphatase [Streptomyces sp. NPDC002044]|uniref:PP2C family protein-serine/threonine phosphatase n=1 Tax=Streptomyces sp. NPDC002044 TaxID=3154662 RepID=UPI00332117B8
MAEPNGLEGRLRAAEEALERIGTSDDERETCRELAGFVFRTLCDAVAVDLVVPGPGVGRVALVGARDLLPVDPPPADPDGAAAAGTGRSARVWTGRTAGGGSAYCVSVPLTGRGEVHGTLLAVRAREGFGRHETAALLFAAKIAGIQVGHARRLAATERTALELQRALVAEPGRPHPNVEIASRYLPAGARALVGGDWFETVRLHFGRTLLVIGDVMGHGLDAAVDMNAYRATLREVAATDLAPHRVLGRLDALAAADGTRRPATCLLVRIDPARGKADYASAGHLPPAVFTGDGRGELLDVPVGPPLGTGFGGYDAYTRPIAADHTLVLYTDGLVERRGEDIDASLARLAALRMPAGAAPAEVVDAVCRDLDAAHAEDDVAVLAARLRPRPAPAPPAAPPAPPGPPAPPAGE